MKARALWHVTTERSEIQEQEINSMEGGILVEALFSFISQGTEKLVASGMVPHDAAKDMEVPYMQGNLSLPCTYGYSMVGRIIGDHPGKGEIVHIMHPHQDLFRVKEEDIKFIPAGITPEVATLHSNMETAVTAVWNSNIGSNDQSLIVGFGNIGALTGIALRQMTRGVIWVSDPDAERLLIAEKMGFSAWNGEPVERVFHTSATQVGLQMSIEALKAFGRVTELSWYGNRSVELNLGGSFHYGNKQIVSSQVSSIPPHMKGWDYRKRSELVWQLLGDENCKLLISSKARFDRAPEIFRDIRTGSISQIGIILDYNI